MPRLSTFVALACAFALSSAPLARAVSAPLEERAPVADTNASDSALHTFDARAPRCSSNADCPIVRNGKGVCTNRKCSIVCKPNRVLNVSKTACEPVAINEPPLKQNGRFCETDRRCVTPIPNASGKCVQNACEITCDVGYSSIRGQCQASLPANELDCRTDSQCATGITNAYGICARRSCQVQCNPGYTIYMGACVASAPVPPRGAAGCQQDSDCASTTVNNALPACDQNRCSYVCKPTFQANAGKCSPTTDRCVSDSECPGGPSDSNIVGVCNSSTGRCDTQCASGFVPRNGRCAAPDATCSCSPVTNGFSTCTAGHCTYQCYAGQGYQLYSDGSSYECINTQNDPENCGSKGNQCPVLYNGLGTRTCKAGQCKVTCDGLTLKTTAAGQDYCVSLSRRR